MSVVRCIKGVVVSDKQDKTVVVLVTSRRRHKKYGKVISITNRLHAHDAENKCKMGDEVSLRPSRPLSALKRWIVLDSVPGGH